MESFALGRSRRPASARRPAPASRASAAFTLLELLIAIAIIGILASLILTVAGSANIKAKNTQVLVDIKNLEQGIAAFRQKFGVEPPSRITLYETATGWTGDPRSMGIIRQIWPQFDFTYAAYPGNQIDINGDGGFTNDATDDHSHRVGVPRLLSGRRARHVAHVAKPRRYGANQAGAPAASRKTPSIPSTAAAANRDRFTEFVHQPVHGVGRQSV